MTVALRIYHRRGCLKATCAPTRHRRSDIRQLAARRDSSTTPRQSEVRGRGRGRGRPGALRVSRPAGVPAARRLGGAGRRGATRRLPHVSHHEPRFVTDAAAGPGAGEREGEGTAHWDSSRSSVANIVVSKRRDIGVLIYSLQLKPHSICK